MFLIWLILIIAWNFGCPEAGPLEDVLVAVVLSLCLSYIKSRPVLIQTFYPQNRPLIFGHRGSPSYITENTRASFDKAIEQGVDGLELDIRLSKDKKIVIFHDKDLQRLSNQNINISDLALQEIQNSSLKRTEKQEKGEKIPQLESIAYLFNKTNVINIEIKTEGLFKGHAIISPLLQFIDKHKANQKSIISSFNPIILWRIKLKKPKTIIGFLYNKKLIFHLFQNLIWMIWIRPENLHIHYSLLDSWIVKWAKKQGMRVNIYTVNNLDIYQKAKKKKIDGIFTDNIEYLK